MSSEDSNSTIGQSKQDGPKQDGPKQDGPKQDGPEQSGPEQSGLEQHEEPGEELRPKLMPLPKNMPELKARLRALWEGEVPLFDTFWVYYFLIVFLLAALTGIGGVVGLLFNIAMLLWMAFMVRPIWKAADGYTGEKIWATLAKIIAILIAISAASQLLRL
jgi:hypothetical protein